jgi:hypothetical protein
MRRRRKKNGIICSFEKTKLSKGAKLAVPTAADLVRGLGDYSSGFL